MLISSLWSGLVLVGRAEASRPLCMHVFNLITAGCSCGMSSLAFTNHRGYHDQDGCSKSLRDPMCRSCDEE